jgi:hypothetical protein
MIPSKMPEYPKGSCWPAVWAMIAFSLVWLVMFLVFTAKSREQVAVAAPNSQQICFTLTAITSTNRPILTQVYECDTEWTNNTNVNLPSIWKTNFITNVISTIP